MVLILSVLALNKALSPNVCITLGIVSCPEALLIWEEGKTVPFFMHHNLLNVPETVYIIPQYGLDSNH